ncbi:uncharacterized protein [Dysidea avara]|uniref:uncharacterized protein isoform X2 n=1 Tax=Dysidea avara TaxID=196820 RepID=UPI0033342436
MKILIVGLYSEQLSNVEVFQSAAPSVSLLEVCITSGCSNDCINNTSPVFHLLQPVYDLSLFTANSQCSEAVVSLFFNAINDDMVNISLDTECIQVRDSSCASEWRITETLFNLTLLDCDSLNATEHISLAKAPILPCPDGYGVLCGSICQPLCAEVSSFSEAATTAYRVLNIIFHGIAIISGIITFVACIYHRKKMFNHPLIFVVYYTVIFQIISYFVVAPYVFGTDSLLCSHPSLVVASADPTAFCKIQGVVIHTGGLIFLGFWLCHLCHVFFSLAYPFRSQQLMKSVQFRKISHLTEVVVVIACGFIPSIAILSTSGYSFTGFPPTCNASDTDVLFYTFTLPYALASTFGLCILLASLWILHKTFKTTSYKEKTSMACANYSTPEAKLMIASLFYVTTNLLILIALAVTLRGINTTLENVTRIALCVAGGDQPECDKYREQLNQHLLPVLVFDLLATSFIALINIVNLLFVLQYKDIKLLTKRVSRLLSTSGVY